MTFLRFRALFALVLIVALGACTLSATTETSTEAPTEALITPATTQQADPTETPEEDIATPTPPATNTPIRGGSSGGSSGGGAFAPPAPTLIIINFPGGVPNDVCSVMPSGEPVNIRAGIGTNTAIIGRLITPAQVVGAQNGWYQIALPNGGRGWVSGSVTRTIGPCGLLGVYRIANAGSPPATMCAAVNPNQAAPIAVYSLPVRTPTVAPQQPIAALVTWAQALSQANDGSIEIIISAGQTGFIDNIGLSLTTPCSNLFNNGGSGTLPVYTNAGTPPTNVCVVVHPGSTAIISIYSAFQATTPPIARLGDWARVSEINGSWYRIVTDSGQTGWINGSVPNNSPLLLGPCDTLNTPQIPVVGNGGSVPNDVCAARNSTNAQVALHSQPNPNSPVLALLAVGSYVALTGEGIDWWQVQWSVSGENATTGWVRAGEVTVFNCNVGGNMPDPNTLPLIGHDGLPPAEICAATNPSDVTVLIYPTPNSAAVPVARLGNWTRVLFTFNDGWLQVETFTVGGGQSGYVRAESVTLVGAC